MPWLEELLDVPEDATVPRFMTDRHPRATGSYGPEFLAWVDANTGLHPRRTEGLRWWQVLVAFRLLEHDAEGCLVWRNALVTVARQVGKSWLIRALVMWRIAHPELFGGEEQTAISMAHKMPTAVEVWRPAARWAKTQDDWSVRYGSGAESVESPQGGRWLIKAAMDGVGVGFALSMLVVDEGWQIKRSVVEAADPALVEAVSPQLLLVSTAGDSASDLFMTYRSQALDEMLTPGNTFIAEWSAPPDADLDDVDAWRAASPHWTARRALEVRDKLLKLDKLEFKQNMLNLRVDFAHGRRADPGVPVVTEAEWDDATAVPLGTPAVAAIEGWFSEGVSVALAYPSHTHVTVSVTNFRDVASAARYAKASGAPTIMVGKSLASDPSFAAFAVTPKGGTSRAAVQDLRRLLDDGVLMHDASPALTEQVLAIRTVSGADGPRIRSTGRMDGVKATVWAAEAARLASEVPAIF